MHIRTAFREKEKKEPEIGFLPFLSDSLFAQTLGIP